MKIDFTTDDMSDAFDYCREADRPVIVEITEGEEMGIWKLFPSGHNELVGKNRESEGGKATKRFAEVKSLSF